MTLVWIALALLVAAGVMVGVRGPSGSVVFANPGGPAKPTMQNENQTKPADAGTTLASADATSKSSAARETAILGGGCFWGMEEILRKIPGVIETSVGYSGGKTPQPTYQQVCTGLTGHAEVVRITFDPSALSFEGLLGYFFRMHDPTTLNRQHNDVGTQYRSAIFYASEEQKRVAEQVIAKVNQSGKFKRPVVTEVTQASTYYPAEDYHQDYLVKNPGGYNCHVLRD